MRNKGYTLAELSVVLVIIGIILVFIVRGSNLTATAHELHDLSVINKLRSAFSTMYGQTMRFPEVEVDTDFLYDMDYFYDSNILTEKDLQSKIVKGSRWALIKCEDQNTGVNENDEYKYYAKNDSPYVCATTVRGKQININHRLICLIERDLDNKNTATGYGRGIDGSDYAFDYENCRENALDNSSVEYMEYAFRIF
jgi:prepilin-type N-terminal cleavage/methylation domain-containing protein